MSNFKTFVKQEVAGKSYGRQGIQRKKRDRADADPPQEETRTKIDPIDTGDRLDFLPPELWVYLLGFVSFGKLLRRLHVSKFWRILALESLKERQQLNPGETYSIRNLPMFIPLFPRLQTLSLRYSKDAEWHKMPSTPIAGVFPAMVSLTIPSGLVPNIIHMFKSVQSLELLGYAHLDLLAAAFPTLVSLTIRGLSSEDLTPESIRFPSTLKDLDIHMIEEKGKNCLIDFFKVCTRGTNAPRLRSLSISSKTGYCSKCVHYYSKFSELEVLSFSNFTNHGGERLFTEVAKLPKLRELRMTSFIPGDDLKFSFLCQMSSLRKLVIGGPVLEEHADVIQETCQRCNLELEMVGAVPPTPMENGELLLDTLFDEL